MFKNVYVINEPTRYHCCLEYKLDGTVQGSLGVEVNCFSSLFSGLSSTFYKTAMVTDIKVRVKVAQVSFSQKSVERWLDDLKEWGFNFKYKKDNTFYTFYYDESNEEKETTFQQKATKIKVALTLLRYLWHPSYFDRVLDAYFQMVDKFKPEDKLKTFYIAQLYAFSIYSSAPGHSIVGSHYYRYCGTNQFFKNLKTKNTVHSCFVKEDVDLKETIFKNTSKYVITYDIEIIYNKYNKLF